MKLLAITIESHDSSAVYFDGNKLHYHKMERSLQFKRWPQYARITKKDGKQYPLNQRDQESYRILKKFWELAVKKIWNISFDQMDEVFFDVDNIESTKKRLDHHERHMLSLELLNYDEPLDSVVVMDGLGGDSWWSVYKQKKLYARSHFNNSGGSIGVGMMILAHRLIKQEDAGKVMGYVSYGNIDFHLLEQFRKKYDMHRVGSPITFSPKWPGGFSEFLRDMRSDLDMNNVESYGSISYFKKFFDEYMELYQIPQNLSEQQKLDYGRTVFERSGEILLEIFKKYIDPNERVGFTGGVAQNVIWNTQLKNIYPNLKILPCTSDECLSLGMMEYLRQRYNLPKMHFSNFPFVESDESPKENPNLDTIIKVSEYLANGKIVAWYQGNGEIGPRALGNRSIFLDPRIHNGKDIINTVKKRESYRPFGASILEEYAKEYFDMNYFNPYMLYVGFSQKNNLPAITHVDNTCRVQTVSKQFPGFLRTLLEQFYSKTKCPVLLNTSLNLAGKPIAGSIEDAKTLFNTRPIDVLVIGNNIIVK